MNGTDEVNQHDERGKTTGQTGISKRTRSTEKTSRTGRARTGPTRGNQNTERDKGAGTNGHQTNGDEHELGPVSTKQGRTRSTTTPPAAAAQGARAGVLHVLPLPAFFSPLSLIIKSNF